MFKALQLMYEALYQVSFLLSIGRPQGALMVAEKALKEMNIKHTKLAQKILGITKGSV